MELPVWSAAIVDLLNLLRRPFTYIRYKNLKKGEKRRLIFQNSVGHSYSYPYHITICIIIHNLISKNKIIRCPKVQECPGFWDWLRLEPSCELVSCNQTFLTCSTRQVGWCECVREGGIPHEEFAGLLYYCDALRASQCRAHQSNWFQQAPV